MHNINFQNYPLLKMYLTPMLAPRTPLIGQDEILLSIEATLWKKGMSNIELVAEAGQGKSAIVQEFAKRNKDRLDVFEVSLSALHGSDKNLGVRLNNLLEELISYQSSTQNKREVILFFDEMHQLPMYSLEAVESIKPKLARGSELGIHIIGATTYEEHIRYIKPNAALTTRFQLMHVPELGHNIIHQILVSHLAEYGIQNNQEINKLLKSIIDYTEIALPSESQPRKSVDTLDTMYGRYKALQYHKKPVKFNIDLLADVIYEKSHYRINFNINSKDIESQLNERVFDQFAAASILSDYAYSSVLNIQNKHKPRGSFLLPGVTGSGKTESVKVFTTILFGEDAKVKTFDMGEYQTKDSVPLFQERLSNAALTAETPVIMLDEIEKAHPDISTLLYSVLDEAKISDSLGRRVNFSNHFIFMTTNIGEDSLDNYSGRAFTPDELSEAIKDMEKTIRRDLANAQNFPHAFLGRISAIVPFIPLPDSTMSKIAKRAILEMKQTIESAQNVKLDLDMPALLSFILDEKVDYSSTAGGARQIHSLVEQQIRNKIAKPIVLNSELNRFKVTIDGSKKSEDLQLRKSKAFVKIIPRSVNLNTINQYLIKLKQFADQHNTTLMFDINQFYEIFTVETIDYSVKSNTQIDQTQTSLERLQPWMRDIQTNVINNKSKNKLICNFTRDTLTGKPYKITLK